MLTVINFDNKSPLQTNEIQDVVAKWDLPAKFEEREPSVTK